MDVRVDHPAGGTPLVTGANLKVASGEVVMIVGAAGVGTSRLVTTALGEASPGAGTVRVLGHDVTKLRRASLRLMRRRIGVVPQDLCLLPDRSAQLNVVLPLEIDGVPRNVSVLRAAEVLAQLGLEDEASLPVDCLSLSVRQRVAVARALVRQPEVLVADHPTSFQDAAGATLVAEALASAATKGAAVLVLARDPALRAIAEQRGWRQLALVRGSLVPMTEIALESGGSLDELLVDLVSAPVRVPEPMLPNVVPFPIARPAGAR
ncbi:MAG TPA: ATP-binding cassette domain-containing protein [Kofleriaceae bacterium]